MTQTEVALEYLLEKKLQQLVNLKQHHIEMLQTIE
jgi:hypothetical protein